MKYIFTFFTILLLNLLGCNLIAQNIKGNTTDVGNGISDNKLNINEVLDIFPNPANQVLNFNFKNNYTENIDIFLVNPVGETVFSKNITNENFALNNTIKIDKLPAGNYYLKVVINNKIYSKSIIVERK